jgi:serine/threonine-protein kinase
VSTFIPLTRSRLTLVCVPLTAVTLAAWVGLSVVRGQEGKEAPAPDKAAVVAEARKILKDRCFECHGQKPDDLEADLNIFDRDTLVQKKIVVPGKPDDSKLVKRVTSQARPMPPKSKPRLADSEAQILRDWIAAGAPALGEAVTVTTKATPPPAAAAPPAPAPAARAQAILRDQCATCHSGARPEGGFRIEDRADLLAKGRVVPSQPEQSALFQRVSSNDDPMPPVGDGRRRLSAEEIAAVRDWIKGGAPEFVSLVAAPPEQVGDEYVLRSILADVRKLAGAGERLESYRYFSLNHLLVAGVTPDELKAHRQALTLVANHLSRKAEFSVPQPIEPTGTVFRLDISRLGWDKQRLQTRDGGSANCTLFDLVLLDYPYGMIYEGSDTYRQLVTEYLTPTRQLRPVAYVRADWFVNTAARPPLYEDLLQLPPTFEALQKQLGVDVADNVKNFRAVRAGLTVSGVSRNNRMVERHEPDGSAYLWVSYDYKSNKGTDNIFQDPVHLVIGNPPASAGGGADSAFRNPTGGEMIFSLPNGLQGYYVANGKGTRLDAAPTEIVTDTFASDKAVRNGLACMRCHDSPGMKTFHDDVRPVLEQLTGSLAAFDRQEALRLYPRQGEIDRLRDRDSGTFRRSLARLFPGEKPVGVQDVLRQVSERFLDQKVTLRSAAPELGVTDPDRISKAFQSRDLAAAGLMELSSGGAVRRDTWEDFYDQVAEQFGRGVPVIPIDGVTRPDYQRPDSRVTFTVSTNRQTLKEGDVLVFTVKNTSAQPIFVELVGTGTEGQKAVLTSDVTSVAAGGTLKKGFKVNAIKGKDQITIYASDTKFDKGELLVFPEAEAQKGLGMGARFIHRQFYQLSANGGRLRPQFDPSRMVKKTVEIETQ